MQVLTGHIKADWSKWIPTELLEYYLRISNHLPYLTSVWFSLHFWEVETKTVFYIWLLSYLLFHIFLFLCKLILITAYNLYFLQLATCLALCIL